MDPRIGYNGNRQNQPALVPVANPDQGQIMGSYHQHRVNVVPQNEGQHMQQQQQQQYMQPQQQQRPQQQMQIMQAAAAVPPPPPPALSLPPGWITATDPVSGRIYYANPTTGQTSWEPPAPLPLPAPVALVPPPPSSGTNVNINMNRNHMPSSSLNSNSQGSNMMGQLSSSYDHSSSASSMPMTATTTTTMQSSLSLNAAHLLIPSTRALINKIQNEQKEDTTYTGTRSNADAYADTNPDSAELHMTAGKIADLSHIQTNYRHEIMCDHMSMGMGMGMGNGNKQHEIDTKYAYEPLKPFSLPVTSAVPHVEGGRVDIRLMTLMETLSKIEKSANKGK